MRLEPRLLLPPALLLLTVLAALAALWLTPGELGLSGHGWLALAPGALATLLLGVALMGLVFYSARRGHDEAQHRYGSRPEEPRESEKSATPSDL